VFDPGITAANDGDRRPTYLRIDDDELEHYFSAMMERYESRAGKNVQDTSETSAPECYDPSDQSPCGASHSSCYISPYGDVQPCVSITMNCGNLREKSFKEVWESSEDILMVRAIKAADLRKCLDCPEPGYCHRCIGDAYLEHGNLLDPSAEFCRRKKVRHRIKRRLNKNG
jgi:radical SAM protein with 4Fe4S-binding SPASM domain